MKKIKTSNQPFIVIALVAAMMFIATLASFAEVKREGNKFIVSTTEKTIRVEQQTPYTYVIKGVEYPIFTKTGTAFYIKRISKSGEIYEQYLDKKVQEQIKKEFRLR
jgi:hypothetical protein